MDDDALRLRADLPARQDAVRLARALVGSWCEAWEVPASTVADAVLVVSEFVTNAVVHGAGPVRLDVARTLEHVVVTVVDGSGGEVRRPVRLVDPGSTSGRGLWIAGALAAHQGSYPTEDGTAVWALIPERAGPERAGPERAGPERAGPERADPGAANLPRQEGPVAG